MYRVESRDLFASRLLVSRNTTTEICLALKKDWRPATDYLQQTVDLYHQALHHRPHQPEY